MNADAETHQEIIIVRRNGYDGEDDHHGGVWKIAFADFMTALMCFFLVMWLINAANEQTRAAVASYFNPVKLIDRNTSRRGLDDPTVTPKDTDRASDKQQDGPAKQAGQKANPAGSLPNPATGDAKKEQKPTDQALFADPYAILSEIAGETGTRQNKSAKGDGGARDAGPATGASGGKAYRDPFAPDFWSQQVDMPQTAEQTARAAGTTPHAAADTLKKPAARAAVASPPTANVAAPKVDPSANAKPAQSGPEKQVAAIAAAISQQMAKAFGKDEAFYKGLSVTPTPRGVLISMTDRLNYGMFGVGSAIPNRDVVLAMEKIARILSAHEGTISIEGHTDGRRFAGGGYDNWRLSTARAQAAYYMLVRAGLDKARVMQIAGFADRKLKVKDNPLADANRRIDILLEPAG